VYFPCQKKEHKQNDFLFIQGSYDGQRESLPNNELDDFRPTHIRRCKGIDIESSMYAQYTSLHCKHTHKPTHIIAGKVFRNIKHHKLNTHRKKHISLILLNTQKV
jgi:phosphoribosylformylglycinamidine (FGAM) synthase-like enzyme